MTFRTWLSASSVRLATSVPRSLRATSLLGIVLLGLSMTEQVTNAQKRGGNTPPPPEPVLPAARYSLTWLDGGTGWEALIPHDINQSGVVVGRAYDPNAQFTSPQSAFAHSSSTGVSINLNGLAAAWWDLNAAERTSALGWRAINAIGINDNGLIVGSASNTDPNLPTRAFILVDAFGVEPYFLLLPTVGAGDHYGRRINNQGEAVGSATDSGVVRYKATFADNWPYYQATLAISADVDGVMDINDNGHLVARAITGGSYRQKSTGETDFVAGHGFSGVSSGLSEMVCGRRPKTNGKNGLPGGSFRMPLFGSTTEALLFPETDNAPDAALNDEGDTHFVKSSGTGFRRGFLYYDATNPATGTLYGVNGDGILPLDKLVVNQDADWLTDSTTRLLGISNRDATGLGPICGWVPDVDRGFLLTPYVP
ncbi:MAG: hypothetical protein WD894_07060 [Pirellulales bacterium]